MVLQLGLILDATCAPSDIAYPTDTALLADAIEKPLAAPTPGEQDEETAAIISGANDFAFDLSEALMKDAEDENFVCSPLSVWLPLAALTNAMDAQDAQSALSVLGAADANVSDLNNAASHMCIPAVHSLAVMLKSM